MQRVAFMIKVKADQIEPYKKQHAAIPPQLTADLRAAGVSNCSLWMGPHGLVFGYLECEDWQSVRDQLSRSDANRQWQARMHAYQEPPAETSGDDMWIHMLELVCLTE